MPGRSEARVFTAIWKDDEFRALTVAAQWLFFVLLSQPDLTHCGVIPFRPARWASKTQGITADQAEAAADELAKAEFVIVDRTTGELMVRSLIRRDRVLRQPFLIIPLSDAIKDVESLRIRAVLLSELTRIRAAGDVNEKITGEVDRLIALLGGHSETHSETHPDRHPDTHSDRHSDTHRERHADSRPDTHADTHTGGRGTNGSNHRIPLTPDSPSPQNPHPPRASAAAADPEGEGASLESDNISQLLGEIRLIRPDWSTRSIERALRDPAVCERPWPLVRIAALALARDPQSQQPGRLAHDGPWWHQPHTVTERARPPWCGECSDEISRQIETGNGSVGRCPRCHPLVARPA